MNCRHCGARLPARPTARVIMTGLLFVAAGLVLVVLVRLAVVVLASVILLVVGGSFLTGAFRATVRRCPLCDRPTR
jgi:hypothetical protein